MWRRRRKRCKPAVQRIVSEHVQDRDDAIRLVPEHLERKLAAAPKHALRLCDTHAVDRIPGKAERHDLGDGKDPTLLERHAQINMDDLASLFVEQDIMAMAVAEAKDMAQDRDSGCAARVCEPGGEPCVGPVELVHEEEVHGGLVVGEHALEFADACFAGLALYVVDDFAAFIPGPVVGEVGFVGGDEVVVQRDCVGNKLDDAAVCAEGYDLVGADLEATLTGYAAFLEEHADLLEYLLHDCILSEIVLACLDLKLCQIITHSRIGVNIPVPYRSFHPSHCT